MSPIDYIVVGAGSAGCVVASRLSEGGDASVLLLEAGPSDSHWSIRMPLGFLRAMFNPRFGWGFTSEPEPGLAGRSLWVPRGRILGGCSSINGMFYMRGHPGDFDEWRDLGCEGWGYSDVLPYFKRSETSWRGENFYHGANGPLQVIPIDTAKLLHEPLMEAARRAGYPTSEDINGERAEGFARGEVTIDRKGQRASAARAYWIALSALPPAGPCSAQERSQPRSTVPTASFAPTTRSTARMCSSCATRSGWMRRCGGHGPRLDNNMSFRSASWGCIHAVAVA